MDGLPVGQSGSLRHRRGNRILECVKGRVQVGISQSAIVAGWNRHEPSEVKGHWGASQEAN